MLCKCSAAFSTQCEWNILWLSGILEIFSRVGQTFLFFSTSSNPSSTFFFFTGRQDKTQIMADIWVTETRQIWLGGVWGRRPECVIMDKTAGSRNGKGTRSLGQKHHSVCPWRKLCAKSPGAKLEALRGNFTLPAVSTHTLSHYTQLCGSLKQAVIKSCSWALLLPSPCDWCLASLAVTNIDWSQTHDDFAPNFFKGNSLLHP